MLEVTETGTGTEPAYLEGKPAMRMRVDFLDFLRMEPTMNPLVFSTTERRESEMKFVMPSKRLLVVAVAVGLLAALPMFVVLAAQGQITEVNPSGISSVQGIVSVGDPGGQRDLKIVTKTSWKVINGQGQDRAVKASFYFSASDTEGNGSPVFVCKEAGGSLSSLVEDCVEKLAGSDEDLAGLGPKIAAFGKAAQETLGAFDLGATQHTGSGTTGG